MNYIEKKHANSQPTDDIDLIFLGYAKSVKKFAPRRQTMVKFQFAKILMEEELQQQLEDGNAVSRPGSSSTNLTSSSTTPILSSNLSEVSQNNVPQKEYVMDGTEASSWYAAFSENII